MPGLEYSYSMPAIHERSTEAISRNGAERFYADVTVDGKRMRMSNNDRARLETDIQELKKSQRMNNLSKPVQAKRTAYLMFKQGMTLRDYYILQRQSGEKYDVDVGRALLGVMLDNGQAVGGKLTAQELSAITENSPFWRSKGLLGMFKTAKNSLTAPHRVLQQIGAWRPGATSRERRQDGSPETWCFKAFFLPLRSRGTSISLHSRRRS